MVLFDLIGKKYDGTRKADPNVVKSVLKLLNSSEHSIVVDIGSGTGNYAEVLAQNGFKVIAVEPSEVMRQQGKKHPNLFWLEAFADDLPLKDNYTDGIICMAAVHHFPDRKKAFQEKLKKDIFSGEWEKRYGKILEQKTFDGGYYFITIKKPSFT